MIAEGYAKELAKGDGLGKETSSVILNLIYQITSQQSEELRVIE